MPRPPSQTCGMRSQWPANRARPVRHHVVQAGADQPERDDPERDRVGEIPVDPASLQLAPRDRTPDQHAEGEQQAVPADVERAPVDEEAARGARDVGEQHGTGPYLHSGHTS